jgi:hypothetical protein
MAASRAIWEFFSERLRFEQWDDDGVLSGVDIDLEGSRAGGPLDKVR